MNPFEISKALDNKKNELFLNLTTKKINMMNKEILSKLYLSKQECRDILSKLNGYRYVDNIDDIREGVFIRWINILKLQNMSSNANITLLERGATVSQLKESDEGIMIVCKNVFGRSSFTIKMEECLIFQKITDQEKLILSVVDYLDT
jgi:hypothetical protein